MKFPSIIILVTFLSSTAQAICTAETRLAGAKAVVYAYNLNDIGATAAAFRLVPFGPNCRITIAANCLPPVIFAQGYDASYAFGVETRQVFSRVTGQYVDFPSNGTTDIITDVTLGVRSLIPIPVTFHADVYLDYNDDCTIDFVRAVATVPSNIANLLYTSIGLQAPYPALNLPILA